MEESIEALINADGAFDGYAEEGKEWIWMTGFVVSWMSVIVDLSLQDCQWEWIANVSLPRLLAQMVTLSKGHPCTVTDVACLWLFTGRGILSYATTTKSYGKRLSPAFASMCYFPFTIVFPYIVKGVSKFRCSNCIAHEHECTRGVSHSRLRNPTCLGIPSQQMVTPWPTAQCHTSQL